MVVFAIHRQEAMGMHVGPILTPHRPPPRHLGRPRAPASGALQHESSSHWPSASHMAMDMFQHHSLTSPTLALSHRGQKAVLHVCVFFCCLAYRITVAVFLNSIYVH